MSKPVCLVTAPVATRSGYGAHSRDIVRALIKLDKYDVKVWNVKWGSTPMNALQKGNPNDDMIIERLLVNPSLSEQPELHIHIVIPNEFRTYGKYNIGITAGLEATAIPHGWIKGLNQMDLNIVPSNFVRDSIKATSFDVVNDQTQQVQERIMVQKPIEVLFEGTDTSIFKKTKEFSKDLVEEFKNIKEGFNFLYTGHWLQGKLGEDRKDTGMLVKVFLETFKNMKNAPGLIMKTSGASFSVLDREEMLNKIKKVQNTVKAETLPNIYLFHGDMSDEEMNEIYNHPKVKAHVNITHGEGFGRPLLEASLSGKPVIASGWSGHLDFLSKELAILVGGKLNDVPKSSFPKEMYVEGSQWFTVNYNEASAVLKEIHKNYKNYTLRANKLSKVNKSSYSLNKMVTELGKILDKYVPEFPKEVELKLPKLKKVGDTTPTKITLPKLKKV
jgi:glycosyltransferase involved in cell wall biosynthesis|tara:strand:+ start:37 stop:1368 length:1332 start_codon:yes stop_codon:yes gene_type:complete